MLTDENNSEGRELNVLVLEDSARDFELIKERLIDAGYALSIERVEAEDAFASALRDKDWDIILADFQLSGFDAFGALRVRNEIRPDTPFICVSGAIGEETAIELLKSGALDYVIKDRPERLPFAVGRALDDAREKRRRQQADAALRGAYHQLEAIQRVTKRLVEDLKAEVQSRKEKEAELQNVTMAVEQAGEGILITDPEGTIEYVNPAFTAVTGYSREEAVGKNPRLLKSGRHDRPFFEDLWATVRAGRVWRGRMVNLRKDGSLYTAEMSISPVKDAAGRILKYVAVKRDITEQMRLHEEKDLLEQQLYQARKMESIGRLAGGVAHDFNNLLTVINGYGDLLLNGLDVRDPRREQLSEIRKAGERAAELTKQLLAFSRKQLAEPKVLDLNLILRDFEKMCRRVLGEDIEVVMRLQPDLGRIKFDVSHLTQVLMNLVVNARDAMPDGGRLVIETENLELESVRGSGLLEITPGKYVLLAVGDSGMGMDDVTRARIFEPFFTTKKPGEGTGLGLSTVYGIVRQAGGAIEADSEPGCGTKFKIYLPRLEEAVDVEETKPDVGDPRGNETILLVEDQANLRIFMEGVLKRYGYKTLSVPDGREAVQLAERHPGPIHLLLTDVVMPGMNGRELAERLLTLRPGLLVLYTSGYTEDAIIRRGVLEADVAFLQKPFTPMAMVRKIRETLGAA